MFRAEINHNRMYVQCSDRNSKCCTNRVDEKNEYFPVKYNMGSTASRLYSFMTADDPVNIVMLGLDDAGKTTLLYQMKMKETVTTVPTIGFNVETLSPMKGVSLTVWDIGGQKKLRPLWQNYYREIHGIIYVVDSADVERMDESRDELYSVLACGKLVAVPLVVFANKQDKPNNIGPSGVSNHLRLTKLLDRKWFVQACCATDGDGVIAGIEELVRMIKEFKRNKSELRQ
ncbi:hypothetical protein ScPMuIL_014485 [Solemya velum]